MAKRSIWHSWTKERRAAAREARRVERRRRNMLRALDAIAGGVHASSFEPRLTRQPQTTADDDSTAEGRS
jgi:hypothetical protein